MQNSKKIKYLVVDSSAFIRKAPIKDLTDTVYCVDGVINEIKDEATRTSLQVLPYDLKFKQPNAESIKFVSNFSKKTGDYYSLSAIDLQLLALTYQLCKENLNGEEFALLKLEPVKKQQQETIQTGQLKLEKPVSIAGFFVPKKNPETKKNIENLVEELQITDSKTLKELSNQSKSTEGKLNEKDNYESQEEININQDPKEEEDSKWESCSDSEENNSDDDGWITPANIEKIKKMSKIDLEQEPIADQSICVGCITSDFSMQNVLIQIGIPVLSIDGLLIKKARSYVLKCTSCLKITSNMSKQFCPNCGYKTLERVLVSIDSNGNKVYTGRRKPASTKGLRFSLPMPRGGKHSNYPILSEDQPRPQNLPSKKSLIKNNPLDPDYTCQASPFVTKDIYSRASRLGIKSADRFNRRK